MGRFLFASILAAVLTAPAFSADRVDTVQSWPDGLKTIDCKAFKHNADGSWTQTGTIIVEPGHTTMTKNTFSKSGETRILDEHCGKKS